MSRSDTKTHIGLDFSNMQYWKVSNYAFFHFFSQVEFIQCNSMMQMFNVRCVSSVMCHNQVFCIMLCF